MFSEPTIQKLGENSYRVSHGGDTSVYAEFSMEAIKDEEASVLAGREIFRNVPHITMMFPGDTTKKVVRPVKMEADAQSPSDPDRFPNQWNKFKNQELQVQDGMPLEAWAMVSKAVVKELKGMNIHTVETLAQVSDGNLGGMMGLRQLRANAQAWLEEADSGAAVSKLQARIRELELDNEGLKNQLNGLGAEIKTPETVTPSISEPYEPEETTIPTRMRGRPKKAV